MRRSTNVAVSKIAAYAEDPRKFIGSGGGAYNQRLAKMGTAAHSRIGAGPSKAVFAAIVLLAIAALLYLKVITL